MIRVLTLLPASFVTCGHMRLNAAPRGSTVPLTVVASRGDEDDAVLVHKLGELLAETADVVDVGVLPKREVDEVDAAIDARGEGAHERSTGLHRPKPRVTDLEPNDLV